MNLTIALVGQPNSGKSTLFNSLAGLKASTGNFPGTTVAYTASQVQVEGQVVKLIDLPGAYSLSPRDAAERVTREFLLSRQADVVVAVLDATILSRGLEMALQLVELGAPMVVAVNLLDEARRAGIEVDVAALERRLGVPVLPTVATRGQGVRAVAAAAVATAQGRRPAEGMRYPDDIEAALRELVALMPPELPDKVGAAPRFVAARLLAADSPIEEAARAQAPALVERAGALRAELEAERRGTVDSRLIAHRHSAAMGIVAAVTQVLPRGPSRSDRIDAVVLHPVWGIFVAFGVFALLFLTAFLVGDALAGLVAKPFDALMKMLEPVASQGLHWALLKGLVDGVAGGLGIVLPYLVPLLLLLSFLEDVGYLPRAAFLLDGVLRRFGLPGKGMIPMILGYGCNVPALMGARMLESPRDRILTSMILPLIPCSARTVVILALVGGILGPWWALGVYLFNLLVAAVASRLVSRRLPGRSLPLVMDMPSYRFPTVGAVLKKVWFRVYQFLLYAWPILLLASLVMAALEYAGVGSALNSALSPLTVDVLGLPAAVGVTLFFGILRKELALVLLFTALGTQDVASVMTTGQIVGFTLFVTFYVPCVSTVATLIREIGWKYTGVSVALSTGLAIGIAALARVAF